jgi:hypothetical protein
MKHLCFLFLLVLLCACRQAPAADVAATDRPPSATPVIVEVTVEMIVEVTREVEVTRQVEVTREVEIPVTVTSSPTPLNSPTPSVTPLPTATPLPTRTPAPTHTPLPTNTPTLTPAPSPTPNLAQTATVQALGVLGAPKGNGFYQVGVTILPGKWRSTGRGDACYWARLDVNQGLLGNHFGDAGGTINIRPSDYEVEFSDCGTWEYVENETPVLAADATQPRGDGFYTVGVEIAPGSWRSTGSNDDCYWARLDGGQDIIDNHFGSAGGTVTVAASDYEVQFSDCGQWEYVGP